MSRAVFLDTGPLGLVTNPKRTPPVTECKRWLTDLLAAGVRVVIPEVADYEVRRELIRAGKRRGAALLDAVATEAEYLPITTAAMRLAAVLWAEARQQGRPTAAPADIDGDVILAAQAHLLGGEVVVATSNVAHLIRYVPAAAWQDIA